MVDVFECVCVRFLSQCVCVRTAFHKQIPASMFEPEIRFCAVISGGILHKGGGGSAGRVTQIRLTTATYVT